MEHFGKTTSCKASVDQQHQRQQKDANKKKRNQKKKKNHWEWVVNTAKSKEDILFLSTPP
jgi:hypothetical protein